MGLTIPQTGEVTFGLGLGKRRAIHEQAHERTNMCESLVWRKR